MTQYSDLKGCSDGGCIIKKPTGMHTNGGCQCQKQLRWVFQQAKNRNPSYTDSFDDYRRILSALQFYQSEYNSK